MTRLLKYYTISRATDIGDDLVPVVTIHIGAPIDREQPIEHLEAAFISDARELFAALKSLPGGTLDQLTVLLLQAKASRFVVRG